MKPSEVIRTAMVSLDEKYNEQYGYWFCNWLTSFVLHRRLPMVTNEEFAAAAEEIMDEITRQTGYPGHTWATLAIKLGWFTEVQTLDRGPGTPYYKRRKQWLGELVTKLEGEGR